MSNACQTEAEKHVRDAGGSGSGSSQGAQDIVAGDKRDRKFMNHLNTYYDQVIQQFEHTEGIVILGRGEAKGELDNRNGSAAASPSLSKWAQEPWQLCF